MSLVCVLGKVDVVSDSLQHHGRQPTRIPCLKNFPFKNTGADCHFLFQGIILTQGPNLCLSSPALAGRFFTTIATWETRGVSYKGTSFIGSEPHPDDLVCVCVCVCGVCMCVHAHSYAKLLQSCPTLCDPTDYSLPSSSVQEISPGKNTGVGYHVLLRGIFPTQLSNSCFLHLLHWQVDFFTASTIWEAPYDFI